MTELRSELTEADMDMILADEYAKSADESTVRALRYRVLQRAYALGHRAGLEQNWPPDCMVVMPREPTEAMIDAAFAAEAWPGLDKADDRMIHALRENMKKEYRAMVQAAAIRAAQE